MKLTRSDGETTIALDAREARLLRYALQRASYIDTPPEEQEAILDLAAKLLDKLEK